jgi:hypothetical protein
MSDQSNNREDIRAIGRFPFPIGKNHTEEIMIERIYARQIALRCELFIALVLSGLTACNTVHANPVPVLSPVVVLTCQEQVKVMAIQAIGPKGNPVLGPSATFDELICYCSDGILRWGKSCTTPTATTSIISTVPLSSLSLANSSTKQYTIQNRTGTGHSVTGGYK